MIPIEMKVGSERLTIDIAKELVIDIDNLDQHLRGHSALLAYWDAMLALKLMEVNNYQVELDRIKANREIAIRNDVARDPVSCGLAAGTKPTEGIVQSLVAADDDLMRKTIKLHELKRDAGVLKALVNGFSSQSAILVTLGGKRRAEVEADLRATVRKTMGKINKVGG